MLQDFKAFFLFLCITIFSWIVSYSDFEELLICYGCNQIEPEYDFVIVGGGTAGCVVARRLAENSSATILILEAGGKGNSLLSIPIASPMLQLSNFDWKYTTTRQTGGCLSMENQKCKFPTGKILGGTHQMNNMLYTRGHPTDYDDWFKDLPGYNYGKDVEEYFNKAEQTYLPNETITNTESPAVITPIRHFSLLSTIILTAFTRLGYITHAPTQMFFGGFYRPMVTQKNGRRWTTSDHLLEMKFPNVAILTKSRAEKIIFRDNFEAVGVKFNYLGEKMFVKAKRALILSAGTVGSAKLLMLSGVGPKEHLTQMDIKVVKDLPVGNNLQDHLTTGLDMVLVDKPLGIGMSDILNPLAALKYLFQAKGTWTSNGVDFIGFSNEEYMHCKNQIKKNATLCYEMFSQNRPDLEVMMLPLGVTSDMGIHLKTIFGITDRIWDEYYSKIRTSTMAVLPVLLHPKSRGTVRLANKNPNTKPLINPNYLNHPYDMRTLLSFIMHCRKLIDRAIKANLGVRINNLPYPGCQHLQFGTLCYWECYVRQTAMTCYHPIGTCKMGLTEDSVVDYNFQVHGMHKLFVVDGSVLPSQTSGHIMGPIIMMAERASEFLKKFHGLEAQKPKLISSKNPA